MNETFWIIGEIIVGIALLGGFAAVVTAMMVPWLSKSNPQRAARDVLDERYARSELNREQ